GSTICRVTGLVVSTQHRGRGVGEKLLAGAADFAREHHCSGIEITSAEHRLDAHRFYQRIGFSPTSFRFFQALSTAFPHPPPSPPPGARRPPHPRRGSRGRPPPPPLAHARILRPPPTSPAQLAVRAPPASRQHLPERAEQMLRPRRGQSGRATPQTRRERVD